MKITVFIADVCTLTILKAWGLDTLCLDRLTLPSFDHHFDGMNVAISAVHKESIFLLQVTSQLSIFYIQKHMKTDNYVQI